jgi:hypothetical protein
LICSRDAPGAPSRQPVAGAVPHGGGFVVEVVVAVVVVVVAVVVVVGGTVVAVVVVVEAAVVDVLVDVVVLVVVGSVVVLVVVASVVVVLAVVVVAVVVVTVVVDAVVVDAVVVGTVVVVVEVVVVVVPPTSQLVPEKPGWQTQTYAPPSVARQMPPLRQGFGVHGWGSVVVVVVDTGVHVSEPGGEDVPGGQGVHEAAPKDENVSAGHVAHDIAPEPLENVPGRHWRHGSVPDGLNVPGVHGCADAVAAASTSAISARRTRAIRSPGGVRPGCGGVNEEGCGRSSPSTGLDARVALGLHAARYRKVRPDHVHGQ